MRTQPDGIYEKFVVHRTDCRDLPGEKHHGCEYFVLDLTHDKHAYMALRAYANSCRDEYPQLAADLIEKSKTMRAAGLFPTLSQELRDAIAKAGAEGRTFAEYRGHVVFINDGRNEERMAERDAVACPACGGSGHKDDAAHFVQRSEILLKAIQAISNMTGAAGFNIGGPVEYCDAANDPESAKELLLAAAEYLKGISKIAEKAIISTHASIPPAAAAITEATEVPA